MGTLCVLEVCRRIMRGFGGSHLRTLQGFTEETLTWPCFDESQGLLHLLLEVSRILTLPGEGGVVVLIRGREALARQVGKVAEEVLLMTLLPVSIWMHRSIPPFLLCLEVPRADVLAKAQSFW